MRIFSISYASLRSTLKSSANHKSCFCQRSESGSGPAFTLGLLGPTQCHPRVNRGGYYFLSTSPCYNSTEGGKPDAGTGRTQSESRKEQKKPVMADRTEMKRMRVKKGLGSSDPTVFFDSLRIFTKAGNGGQGLPRHGGVGGRGGNVVAVGHREMSLSKLITMFPNRRFIADGGADAKFFCLIGEPGKDVNVPVPLGVSIITEYGHKLGEVNTHGEKLIMAAGGAGASPSNSFAAEVGQAHNVALDLKLIADVGFVGFPNAGKSTLLKALSKAKPKIASYPFTTIRPNVGVMEYTDFRTISLADLPGLIEGAHTNIGMGHKFLKHVERTKVLLFVVDLHGFQLSPQHPKRSALETVVLLNKELELYKEELTDKPAVLALNKMDLPGSYKIVQEIKEIMSSQSKYEQFLKSMPTEFLPENVIMFDHILPISAATDPISVGQLQKFIRKVIDYYDPYQTKSEVRLIET